MMGTPHSTSSNRHILGAGGEINVAWKLGRHTYWRRSQEEKILG